MEVPGLGRAGNLSSTRSLELWKAKTVVRIARCLPPSRGTRPLTPTPQKEGGSRGEEDTVLILRPPLAMATAAWNTENTAMEQWPQLTQILPPCWKLQETQRLLFSCNRDRRKVLEGTPE